MGRISQSIARKATALGMKVMYTDIFEIKGLPEEYVCATQEEVLKNADFVSLHIPAAKDGKACDHCRASGYDEAHRLYRQHRPRRPDR